MYGAVGFSYSRQGAWRFKTSQQCLALLIQAVLTERHQKAHAPCDRMQYPELIHLWSIVLLEPQPTKSLRSHLANAGS